MVRLPALLINGEPYDVASGQPFVQFMWLPGVYALRQFDAVCKTALNRVHEARRLAGTHNSVGRSFYSSRSGVVGTRPNPSVSIKSTACRKKPVARVRVASVN